MPLALCLGCGGATAGELCCIKPDLIPITPLSSPSEKFIWWTRRMIDRRADLDPIITDRKLALSILARGARERRRRFDWINFEDVANRFRRIPFWWRWTAYLAYAMAGQMVAAAMTMGNRRGF